MSICDSFYPNTKDYFQHINFHLKRHETIECAFHGCDFKTNIYGTYATHRSRKHRSYSWKDFKTDVIAKHPVFTENEIHFPVLDSHGHVDIDTTLELGCERDNSTSIISGKCVDDLVEQLQFICTSSTQYIPKLVNDIFTKNNCAVDEAIEVYPTQTSVNLANVVIHHGTKYAAGMVLPYGSTGGLPDFVEISQIVIVDNNLSFIVKFLNSWYDEHFRAFMLDHSGKMTLLQHSELGDTYPLAAYFVEGKRMMDLVALKVIIEHRSEKLLLSSGIPSTVEQLHETVKETFGLIEDFTLHYLDEDFGDYFTLHSTNQIKHKGTIKVVIIPSIVLTLTENETNITHLNDSSSSATDSMDQTDGMSVSSQDTVLLSPRESPQRTLWPDAITDSTAIKDLMCRTFAHRRHDVISLQMSIEDIKDRWPVLFDVSQVSAEFQRITTLNLEPKFMSMLDFYSPKLLSMFQGKGCCGERHRAKMSILLQSGIPIQRKREVVIRCLIDHLGEDASALIKDFEDAADAPVSVQEELAEEAPPRNITAGHSQFCVCVSLPGLGGQHKHSHGKLHVFTAALGQIITLGTSPPLVMTPPN
ncbi:hypothetical protein F7725_013609 [Dissostichus mawsoni]|uniref:Uncharacterized protein n=1 Tax=Dissostichus mawsoni TaxID=36200 RepID=A0A7J5Y7F0_DISMA|nr:hypothetical protein F7725_013609 [Dissostichus mawsoni]